jgi:hypothetical protein
MQSRCISLWGYVQLEFNKYTQESGQPTREAESLKHKFQALAKPDKTNRRCRLSIVRLQGQNAQISINRQAHVISCNDIKNTNEG